MVLFLRREPVNFSAGWNDAPSGQGGGTTDRDYLEASLFVIIADSSHFRRTIR